MGQEQKKRAPLDFKQTFVGFFFKNLSKSEDTLNVLEGFKRQGYDLEEFYWMNPELETRPEDIREILKEKKNYGLLEERVEEWIDKYSDYYKKRFKNIE